MAQHIIYRAYRKIVLLLFNNIVVNQILIILRCDHLIKKISGGWKQLEYDESKSLSENVGYSTQYQEIEASLIKMHSILKEKANQFLKKGDSVLEIGCGTGLFLADLKNDYMVSGIDLNNTFLEKAKQLIPNGTFRAGNYLDWKVDTPLNMIYLVSVLQYIEPSHIRSFFKKIYGDLQDDGIILIHYSHALSEKDLWYPNLRYVRYSPKLIEAITKKYFTILEHHHFTDDRTVGRYDTQHYYFPDGTNKRTDTNLNTCLFIGRKQNIESPQ